MCEETYKWDLYIYLKKTYKSDMYIREKIINDVCIYITRTTNKTYSYMWDVYMRNIYTWKETYTSDMYIFEKVKRLYMVHIYTYIYEKRTTNETCLYM